MANSKGNWPQILISDSLNDSNTDFENSPHLEPCLRDVLLKTYGISILFPIQDALLSHFANQRPGDLCICAPTGSGKTLAYLLPIIQALRNRKVVRLRAVVVVPVRELALQVASVSEPLAQAVGLHIGTAIGATSLSTETRKIISSDGESLVDLLIATPGRLLDLLEGEFHHQSFSMEHVEWLVFDEADRLLDGFTQDWLPILLAALHNRRAPGSGNRTFRTVTEAPFESLHWTTPVKKLLLSATLTQNPAKLMGIQLNNPSFMSVIRPHQSTGTLNSTTEATSITATVEIPVNHTTPANLSEFIYVCEEARKPIGILYYLRHAQSMGPALCFSKSVITTIRLCKLLQGCVSGDQKSRIAAYSAEQSPSERTALLQAFQANQLDLLICSDSAARGLDLPNVALVINYDAPKHLRTYIHRVGRTARAGKPGKAYTILAIKEAHYFKQMLKKAGKERLSPLRIPKGELIELVALLESALHK